MSPSDFDPGHSRAGDASSLPGFGCALDLMASSTAKSPHSSDSRLQAGAMPGAGFPAREPDVQGLFSIAGAPASAMDGRILTRTSGQLSSELPRALAEVAGSARCGEVTHDRGAALGTGNAVVNDKAPGVSIEVVRTPAHRLAAILAHALAALEERPPSRDPTPHDAP